MVTMYTANITSLLFYFADLVEPNILNWQLRQSVVYSRGKIFLNQWRKTGRTKFTFYILFSKHRIAITNAFDLFMLT